MTVPRHKLAVACLSTAAALLLTPASLSHAQVSARSAVSVSAPAGVPARITGRIVESQRTPLAGHIRPFLKLATDHGEVSGSTPTAPMMLMFTHTAQQQADLDALADSQHNARSAQFHQWLTPEQFGAKFGPADSDVAQVRTWLESKGFTVLDVPPSKQFISFKGTTGQLKEAFGLSIHAVTIQGEQHAANINEPQVPTALASVIGGIHGLDNFAPRPLIRKAGMATATKGSSKVTQVPGSAPAQPRANFTTAANGLFQVGPQDFYTIYNENPLLAAGITGAGQTIAVIEEALINPADVTSFRSFFGLPAYPSTPNATAGGLTMFQGSTSGLNGYASCYSPATLAAADASGEEGEAALDAEWAGAVAPNAIVDFVACGGTATNADGRTLGALGIDHSAQYVANYLAGTVVAASMSYGECEADLTSSATSGIGYYNNQWQQFAVEGITPIISSGDGGSEQCYQDDAYASSLPPSVNGFGSSAWNVAAGGTDFSNAYQSANYTRVPESNYFSSTNGTGQLSAAGYQPESAWAGYCSDPEFASSLQYNGSTTFGSVYTGPAICSSSYSTANGYTAVVGGAGGISTYNTIPTWQSVYGIGTNNVSSTYRNVPDVSLFAANGFWGNILPYCESDIANNGAAGSCNLAAYSSTTTELIAGGTSFVAPQLAGFFALVAQSQVPIVL